MARSGPWLVFAAFGCSFLMLTPGCRDPNPTFNFDAAAGAAGRDGAAVDTAPRPDLAPSTPDASDGGAAGAGP